MFIQTEPTPNPNALKFLPGREVSAQPREFLTIDEATASPLAEALFQLEGVAGVFFGADYVSVTRDPAGLDWPQMKAPILAAIMDHFVSGAPLLRGGAFDSVSPDGDDSEIVAEIKQLLDSRIRPAVAQAPRMRSDSTPVASSKASNRMSPPSWATAGRMRLSSSCLISATISLSSPSGETLSKVPPRSSGAPETK